MNTAMALPGNSDSTSYGILCQSEKFGLTGIPMLLACFAIRGAVCG